MIEAINILERLERYITNKSDLHIISINTLAIGWDRNSFTIHYRERPELGFLCNWLLYERLSFNLKKVRKLSKDCDAPSTHGDLGNAYDRVPRESSGSA